jgi:uncharacterized protein YbaR (Trm112 family)
MKNAAGSFDPRILKVLVCPISSTSLIYNQASEELISIAGRVAFPIRDGIPILLEGATRPLREEEMRRLSAEGVSGRDR